MELQHRRFSLGRLLLLVFIDGDAPAAASCIVEGVQRFSSARAAFRLWTTRFALGSALASPKPVDGECPLRVESTHLQPDARRRSLDGQEQAVAYSNCEP